MATCDELATQLTGLQSQLATLQKKLDNPDEACADFTGRAFEECIQGLRRNIATTQIQITDVQQQQQAQGCLNPPSPPPVTYEFIDLGTLGGAQSIANDINNVGQVVGWSNPPDVLDPVGTRHAFLWSASSGMQDLGTLGGGSSSAYDVNNAGQVVGTSYRSFLWSTTTGMQDLNSLLPTNSGWFLAGDGYSEQIPPISINETGQIVGSNDPPGIYLGARAWLLRKHQN